MPTHPSTLLHHYHEQRRGGTPVASLLVGDHSAAATVVDEWAVRLTSAVVRVSLNATSELATLMLDEADIYLPAVRQPATKNPLESLLRRARSAGLG